jgi:hypothetical protein
MKAHEWHEGKAAGQQLTSRAGCFTVGKKALLDIVTVTITAKWQFRVCC